MGSGWPGILLRTGRGPYGYRGRFQSQGLERAFGARWVSVSQPGVTGSDRRGSLNVDDESHNSLCRRSRTASSKGLHPGRHGYPPRGRSATGNGRRAKRASASQYAATSTILGVRGKPSLEDRRQHQRRVCTPFGGDGHLSSSNGNSLFSASGPTGREASWGKIRNCSQGRNINGNGLRMRAHARERMIGNDMALDSDCWHLRLRKARAYHLRWASDQPTHRWRAMAA